MSKIKTFLLLKEQSPELIHRFASGLINDNDLINALAKGNIFYDIQDEFKKNASVFAQSFFSNGCIPFDIVKKNVISMAENPLMKLQAFYAFIMVSMGDYQDEENANILKKLYDPYFLDAEGIAPFVVLRYINFLLKRNEKEKASIILKEYLKRHPVENTLEFLPIADLACQNGITNEDITTASKLYQTIMGNVENRLLENYIDKFGKDASIAIVGNGPYELGLGKGEQIDAHDIVVRFNAYDDSEKYTIDYGKKTNIVFYDPCSPRATTLYDRKIELYVIYSLFWSTFSTEGIKKFKKEPFTNITTLDFLPIIEQTQKLYNINWPTTGFRAVYLFKNILNKKNIDIYGMYFSKGRVMSGHYEDIYKFGDFNKLEYHNLNIELKAMQDMFRAESNDKK